MKEMQQGKGKGGRFTERGRGKYIRKNRVTIKGDWREERHEKDLRRRSELGSLHVKHQQHHISSNSSSSSSSSSSKTTTITLANTHEKQTRKTTTR